MEEFLRSRRPKQWFRAYLNRGLVDFVAGAPRRLECTGGSDIFFLDPWGEVYPVQRPRHRAWATCTSPDFDEIWHGARARGGAGARCAPATAAAG